MASAATDAAYASLNAYKPKSSQAVMEEANTKYDVGGSQTRLSALKGLVGNLQSSVEAVDPSVTGRTSGTFTTEGQRQALVSKERAPILGDLAKQQSAYSDEQGALTQKQALASQMASALLNDDKASYQRLLDQYNIASTKDKEEESRRQYEQSLAEQRRQFDITAAQNAKAAASKGGGGGKTSAISELIDDIRVNVKDFRSRKPGWTENVLIPDLEARYPELTRKEIIDRVYSQRKQYE